MAPTFCVTQRDKYKSQASLCLGVLIKTQAQVKVSGLSVPCPCGTPLPDRNLRGCGDVCGKSSLQGSSVSCLPAANPELLGPQ